MSMLKENIDFRNRLKLFKSNRFREDLMKNRKKNRKKNSKKKRLERSP